ncbi:MAG TPA: serine protease [Sedimentisphaerales bacterium]
MKRIITVIFGLAAFVLSVICGISGQTILSTNESLFTQCGAIMIRSNTLPIASGFTLGPQKDVVTCWHVLEGARVLYHDTNLLFISGQGVNSLKLKYALPSYDLAVFSANPPINGAPFHAGDFAKLNEGDTIIYMGYDKKQSSTIETSTEIAYAWAGKKFSMTNGGVKVDRVLFVGDIGPGWSGGPVFNTNLEVVAVIIGHGGQNVVTANSIAPILDYEKSRSKTNASPVNQSAPH